ncbi:hypothetical protein M0G43_09665 [Subsaxibacter sp. CAU 1640]|uniref:DUF6913 domain-containing protein n=1 Tax=Subsaxibacter sp. CAU 1640 TaxID=2933271 RepID=UPI00200632A0|nr:hypothetical protein [Subsaxibacter sp. CAU 1640]MCK7590840.1 hypothetical protein [Subsaxibacter sp. CAU 1640]
MIFKAFKERSNQKHINRLLNSRNVKFTNTKISSIGVVLTLKEFGDLDAIRTFAKELDILPPKTKIITFVEDNKITDKLWDTYFSPKDFGWNGAIKNMDLQNFIDTQFDILICFYNQHSVELNLVTASSKANFKVGISNENLKLYDFVIDVKSNQFELFKIELKKYLTVLNKL